MSYIKPTLNWAKICPCSANGVHSRNAVSKSPLFTAASPLSKSAPQLEDEIRDRPSNIAANDGAANDSAASDGPAEDSISGFEPR